ncbi:unnamed protein product [Ambrosiozyma monospora]|uniref:Unnamed protein product n=1 Tax=Ambrosiozyma monospora TaxID=43982 RepID=A0ACB5TCK7_AMBMO|nr:unnamed protein product [Ambrosiozyma monospora]
MSTLNQLIFPNLCLGSVPTIFLTAIDIIRGITDPSFKTNKKPKHYNSSNNNNNENDTSQDDGSLFINASSKLCFQPLKSSTTTLKPCAVGGDPIEYDFTSSNPMNWNLQEFVMNVPNSDSGSYQQSTVMGVDDAGLDDCQSFKPPQRFDFELPYNFNNSYTPNNDNNINNNNSSSNSNSNINLNLGGISDEIPYSVSKSNNTLPALLRVQSSSFSKISRTETDEFSDIEDDLDDVQYHEDINTYGDDYALDDECCMNIGREGHMPSNSIITTLPLEILQQLTGVDFTGLKKRRLSDFQKEDLLEEELTVLTDEAQKLKRRLILEDSPITEEIDEGSSSYSALESPPLGSVGSNSPGEQNLSIKSSRSSSSSSNDCVTTSKATNNIQLRHRRRSSIIPATLSTSTDSPSTSSHNHNHNNSAEDLDHPFTCKICHTSFKVKSYLTRHMKKHETQKPFTCPFYSANGNETSSSSSSPVSTSSDNSDKDIKTETPKIPIGTNCHPTGGFSRRDTFKTHLKAIHFVYPTGTKSSGRNDSPV